IGLAYGVAAYNRGEFPEAVEELEAAAAAAPDDGNIQHWLGLAHLANGDPQAAQATLEAALRTDLPSDAYRARVRSDLERARSATAGESAVLEAPGFGVAASRFGDLPPWELRLFAGYGEDDNPLLVPDGGSADLPGGGVVSGPQSDEVLRLGARGTVRPWSGDDWSLALTGELADSRYSDFDFLDFQTLAATASLTWGGDPSGFAAGPLGYARVPLGRPTVSLLLQGGWAQDALDGDTYLTRVELGGALTVNEGASASTRLSAAWSDRDYEVDGVDAFERSGSELSAAVDQFFFFGSRHRYLSFGVGARERDAGEAYASSALDLHGELSLPFGSRWRLRLGAGQEEIDYDELESNPGFPFFLADRPREDTRTRWSASLTWKAVERLYVTVGGRWLDAEVDVGEASGAFFDYDHERTVITANVSWYLLGGGR
ncbi:MAG TPA: tetratricopeptide repeat protein, partial [Thermoanaerobaculia bacterium]|nr:tetratricopeptide repeat protein [Thermoanaerobaculia bacterium]